MRYLGQSLPGLASDFLPVLGFYPISYRSEFSRGTASSAHNITSRPDAYHITNGLQSRTRDPVALSFASIVSPIFLLASVLSPLSPPQLGIPATRLRGGRGTTRSMTDCRGGDKIQPTTHRSAVRLSRETRLHGSRGHGHPTRTRTVASCAHTIR